MSERKALRWRDLTAAGVAAGTLLVSAAAAEALPLNSANENHDLRNSPGLLAKGDKVTNLRVIEPTPRENTSFQFAAGPEDGTKDVAFIFDPLESDWIIQRVGEPELEDGVGFAVESSHAKTILKRVFFNTKTKRVSLIDVVQTVKKPQAVYSYVDGYGNTHMMRVVPETNTRRDITVSFEYEFPKKR